MNDVYLSDGSANRLYYFSVVRIVADIVRDEATNIGVIVLSEDDGLLAARFDDTLSLKDAMTNSGLSREAIRSSIESIRTVIGVEPHIRFGETYRTSMSVASLESLADYLSNQVQITRPMAYQSQTIDSAIDSLFLRYVARRSQQAKARSELTHAGISDRIWRTVKAWTLRNMLPERDSSIQGWHSAHLADVVIRNGSPRAAFFAIPASPRERRLAFYLRDSLSSIAIDVDYQYPLFAVFPSDWHISTLDDTDAKFIVDSKQYLIQVAHGVTVITIDQLDQARSLLNEQSDLHELPAPSP